MAMAVLPLMGVSFDVRAGEQVAIVGESGAGKSTILSLIAGFLEPSAGAVLIDGRPLASLDLEDVRRHIAFLPQRAFLFDATIAENVAMNRPGDVAAALKAAQCRRVRRPSSQWRGKPPRRSRGRSFRRRSAAADAGSGFARTGATRIDG